LIYLELFQTKNYTCLLFNMAAIQNRRNGITELEAIDESPKITNLQ